MQIKKIVAATAVGASMVFASSVFAADHDAKPKQSAGEYTSDAVVTTKVKAAIVAEKNLSALDIAVETVDGTTQLSGSVATAAQADHAARVARGVEGVKQVKNLLKVDASKAK